MRVLVTGANSLLGRQVINDLVVTGEFRISALDVDFAQRPAGVDLIQGDVRDRATVARSLCGAQAVVHLAPQALEGEPTELVDMASRGTYVVMTEAQDQGVGRLVLGSSLELFSGLPPTWRITPEWRPRPVAEISQLCPWLKELSARELAHARPDVAVTCIRFGRLPLISGGSQGRPEDIFDAAAEVRRALSDPARGWSIRHVGDRPVEGAGTSTDSGPSSTEKLNESKLGAPIASRAIRRVVVLGAGGPLGAAIVARLAPHYTLRIADVRPLQELLARAEWAAAHDMPHMAPLSGSQEFCEVDITDQLAVLDACEGADAVVNCTVIRNDPVLAFRVNTLGAYNAAVAAVRSGIRRIVQTGPQLFTFGNEGDYSWDYDIPDDAPPRPGRHLYGHSKYLGQEILRVFSDSYGLETAVLLFSHLQAPSGHTIKSPLSVSWTDAAGAVLRALQVAALPRPYDTFNIGVDLPHGKFRTEKARNVLGWEPQDDFRHMWVQEDGMPSGT